MRLTDWYQKIIKFGCVWLNFEGTRFSLSGNVFLAILSDLRRNKKYEPKREPKASDQKRKFKEFFFFSICFLPFSFLNRWVHKHNIMNILFQFIRPHTLTCCSLFLLILFHSRTSTTCISCDTQVASCILKTQGRRKVMWFCDLSHFCQKWK